jgi:uncharacterized protein YggE
MKHILILGNFLIALNGFGQTNAINTNEPPFIEVNGTAEKEVIPDEIYIDIIIREKMVNREKVTIEAQEEILKNAVKALGINLANLYLSDANADYVKVRWQKKEVLTKKDYTLRVSNATTVGQVFMELEKLEITDAYISKVNHSKMDSLRKEVKILAIKAAKDKADYLLTAIGEQTGKPLIIREEDILTNQGYSNVSRGVSTENAGYYERNKDKDGNEIQFQKIKIKASIYVKFSIK